METVSRLSGTDCSRTSPGSTGESHSETNSTPAASEVKIERVAVTCRQVCNIGGATSTK